MFLKDEMVKASALFILICLSFLTSCQDSILQGNVRVTIKETRPEVSRVKVVNDQLIVTGTNLDKVTLAKVEGSTNHDFTIESKSSNQLVLNAKSVLTFLVGQTLNLIVSNAHAAATFPITFELQNGQVTAAKLHHMGASPGQYLRFNGTSWAPGSISSSQLFAGAYDASTDTPDIVSAGGSSGTYYIVTVAGTQDLGSGPETYDVGDWVIYNGSAWSRIAVGTNTVSGFNGRTGLVVPLAGDYSWSMLTKASGKLTGSKISEIADVDVTGIQDGDILQWNAGNTKWEVIPVPTLTISAGSITNTQIAGGAVDSSKITDGSIVNADISATAAIDQSKINGLTTDLNNKEPKITDGTATQYWSGNKTWQNLNPAVIGSALTGYSASAGAISAADTILSAFNKVSGNLGVVAASQANYVLKAGDTMSGPLAMGNNKITGLATPTVGTDAATKDYVDTKAGTASQWITNGSDIHYPTGNVGIGTTAPTAALNIVGDGSATDDIGIDSYSATPSAGPAIFLNRARGTSGTPTAVSAGDTLGLFSFKGYDGAAWATGGAIVSRPETNWTTTASTKNAYMAFHTLNAGSGVERVRISSAGNFGIGTASPIEKLDVVGNMALTGKVRLKSDTVNYVELQAPAGLAGTLNFRLPATAGTSGQALTTDGSGNLSWAAVSSGAIADGSVGYTKLNLADGDIPLAKLAGASDATKYLKGDKTWGTFLTDVLASTFATVTPSNTVIANGDSIQTVVNKTQGQINQIKTDAGNFLVKNGTDSITGDVTVAPAGILKIATTASGVDLTEATNVQYVQNYVDTFGQWNKNGSAIYTNKFVGFGNSTPLTFFHALGTGGVDDDMVMDSIGDTGESAIMLRRARGTAALPTPPLANDRLGFLGFRALTVAPNTYNEMARVQGAAETNIATSQSGMLQFWTRNNGTYLEKMRLNAEGNLSIGTIDPSFYDTDAGAALNSALTVKMPVAGNGRMLLLPGTGGTHAIYGMGVSNTNGKTIRTATIGSISTTTAGSESADLLFSVKPSTGAITEGMRISSSGNVGIGTTTPEAKLHVAGTDWAGSSIYASRFENAPQGSAHWGLKSRGATVGVYAPVLANDLMAIFGGSGYFGTTSTDLTTAGYFAIKAEGNWSAGNTPGSAQIILNKGTDSYTVPLTATSTGRVGIGTTSPTSTLEVASDATAAIRGVTITHTVASNTPSLLIMRKSRGTTASPTAILANDHLGYLAMSGHDGTNYVLAGNPTGILATATENWSATGNGGFLRFYTTANGAVEGTERMRISQDGNVGIGTTSNPTAKLQVQGTLNGDVSSYLLNTDDVGTAARTLFMVGTVASGTRYGYLSHQGAGYTADGALKPRTTVLTGTDTGGLNLLSNTQIGFWVGPSEIMRVHSTGNVGIGTAAPSYKLHVNGSVAGVGAYNALSDRRYKKDFEQIPDALERVVKMNGFYYRWKQEENPEMQFEKGRDMGVIAQEVEKVFPEAVSTAKTSGIKSVAYSKLIAPMIEAIKELHQMVVKLFDSSEKHTREIASIKEENRKLKAKSVQLEQENAAFKAYLCQKDPQAVFCKN